jgi:hypothetical protein
MNMQTLVNLLQEGSVGNKGGQLALVCMDPNVADLALAKGLPIPESEGKIGLVEELEHCIEAFIQEDIYSKLGLARARLDADKWKALMQKKWKGRTTISSVADQVMAAEHAGPGEPTNALSPSFDEKSYDPSYQQFQEYFELGIRFSALNILK